jgi:hypothetical protein
MQGTCHQHDPLLNFLITVRRIQLYHLKATIPQGLCLFFPKSDGINTSSGRRAMMDSVPGRSGKVFLICLATDRVASFREFRLYSVVARICSGFARAKTTSSTEGETARIRW